MRDINGLFYWNSANRRWEKYQDTEKPKKHRSSKKIDNELLKYRNLSILTSFYQEIVDESSEEADLLHNGVISVISTNRLFELCFLRALKYGLKYTKTYHNIDDIEDTIQNALLGACVAINSYQEGSFINHLNFCMRKEILNGMPVGERICCLPGRVKPDVFKILTKAQSEDVYQEMSTSQLVQMSTDLGTVFHEKQDIINNLMYLLLEPQCIDDLIDSEDICLSDNGLYEEKMIEEVQRSMILASVENIMEHFSEREKIIVVKAFGFHEKPMTLDKIGRMLGITKERVQQIENKLLKELACLIKLNQFTVKAEQFAPQHSIIGKNLNIENKNQNHINISKRDNRKKNFNKENLNTEAKKNDSSNKSIKTTKKNGKTVEMLVIENEFGTRTITFEY